MQRQVGYYTGRLVTALDSFTLLEFGGGGSYRRHATSNSGRRTSSSGRAGWRRPWIKTRKFRRLTAAWRSRPRAAAAVFAL